VDDFKSDLCNAISSIFCTFGGILIRFIGYFCNLLLLLHRYNDNLGKYCLSKDVKNLSFFIKNCTANYCG